MPNPRFTPCQLEPELWFSTDPGDQYEAIQACGFCPIGPEACAPLRSGEIHGVWGGVLVGRTKTVVQPEMRTCALEGCGEQFVARTATLKFCSKTCADTDQRQRRAALPACAWKDCGKKFTPKMRSQRFCSPQCGRKNKRATAHRTKGLHRLNELVEAAS